LKTVPTKTLNPLPFGDLEPHRFEDLVRQLAYEFRRWRSLEATGRAGSDSGIDIRATELVPVDDEPADGDEDETPEETAFQERLWIFQCKRDVKHLEDFLISDTMLLTAIYLIVESCQVGMDAHETLRKFRGSFNYLELPLT
jgi:hypothetical protein